jgi:hypothetical protein
MDDLNAEMEVLQNLAARTPRFTAIDDLPLEREEPSGSTSLADWGVQGILRKCGAW